MDIPNLLPADEYGLQYVRAEIDRARGLHDPMSSAHEAYSVILEELDEFWEEVKKKREKRDPDKLFKELIQVAAMCVRAATDLHLTP